MIDLGKLGIRIGLLGKDINLGNTGIDELQKMRDELKKAGAPELLSDKQWRSGMGIPPKTGRDIRHIPPSAGFQRGFRSPRSTVAHGRTKASETPFMKVEEDTTFDEEFQTIPELDKVLSECLVAFPEVSEVGIRATHSSELSGCKGTHKDKTIIILFVPDKAWGKWLSLKPIIYHELSHFLSKTKEGTERIFFERADKKSQEMWRRLKEVNAIDCEVKEMENGKE